MAWPTKYESETIQLIPPRGVDLLGVLGKRPSRVSPEHLSGSCSTPPRPYRILWAPTAYLDMCVRARRTSRRGFQSQSVRRRHFHLVPSTRFQVLELIAGFPSTSTFSSLFLKIATRGKVIPSLTSTLCISDFPTSKDHVFAPSEK